MISLFISLRIYYVNEKDARRFLFPSRAPPRPIKLCATFNAGRTPPFREIDRLDKNRPPISTERLVQIRFTRSKSSLFRFLHLKISLPIFFPFFPSPRWVHFSPRFNLKSSAHAQYQIRVFFKLIPTLRNITFLIILFAQVASKY